MILNGDGHAGLTAGDSLGDYARFDSTIMAQCSRGIPTKILTNPPFAGVGEGRVSDEPTLTRFECGKRWEERQNGKFEPTQELIGGGMPPEMLFLERCIDWLAPGGMLAIVMPKGFLDNANYRPARTILFKHCQVLGIVNCHKDTFQPHTGVRTCLVFARKFAKDEKRLKDYSIFMAVSRKIGQDSEGVPIFKRDDLGKPTNELDHDLDELLKAYQKFRGGNLKPSQYAFTTKYSELDAKLRMNPQLFLPHLNETLQHIEKLDGIDGWSVSSLGQLSPDIQIFKGPRFKSSDLVVESKTSERVEPYYTPSAVSESKPREQLHHMELCAHWNGTA
jgi:type I restriction-modification system DNA methylase subunit